MTPEEPTFRREHGMCFTCDERYLRGHYGASKASLLVAEDEDSNSLNTDPVDPTLDLKPTPNPDPKFTPDSDPKPTSNPDPIHSAQISLTFFSGDLAPRNLRPAGLISGNRVVILVDGRSTHTFFQPQLSISLSLPNRTAPTPLREMFLPHEHFVELQVRQNKP